MLSNGCGNGRHIFRMRGRVGKTVQAHPQIRSLMEALNRHLLQEHQHLSVLFSFEEEKE